jgi:hypothetical protein
MARVHSDGIMKASNTPSAPFPWNLMTVEIKSGHGTPLEVVTASQAAMPTINSTTRKKTQSTSFSLALAVRQRSKMWLTRIDAKTNVANAITMRASLGSRSLITVIHNYQTSIVPQPSRALRIPDPGLHSVFLISSCRCGSPLMSSYRWVWCWSSIYCAFSAATQVTKVSSVKQLSETRSIVRIVLKPK